MADPFVAEIRILPFNFAPRGWAFCNGQVLPISQNTALFSLLGTTYGGNGQSTFALPDLQGRAPVHPGQGPGLSLYDLGQSAGQATVTLTTAEMAAHNHMERAATADLADTNVPGPAATHAQSAGGTLYQPAATAGQTLSSETLVPVGSNQPHNNMQPYLTLNFNIALQGVFPPRG